jgi:diguanylate cyclase (GGDEF)-like protein
LLEAITEDIRETPGLRTRTDPDAVELSSAPRATGERRRPESTNPPRLIVRFAIYLAIGLALAAGGILVFVRQSNTTQAESYARERAELIGGLAMPIGLDAGSLSRPIRGVRKRKLDAFFRAELARGTILSAAVYRLDGRRLYTVGTGSKRREPRAQLLQTVRSGTTSVVHKAPDGKRLAVYTSFKPAGSATGVLALEQDYAPIAQAARRAFVPIAGVLQFVMLFLFLMFIPLLRRITHRLRSQMGTIQHQALHDDLTDLPNRTLLNDRIEQAVLAAERSNSSLAIMVLDLDRFKEINDTLGHHAGDVLLQEVALRLRETVRASDTVARIGGDEFGVLSPETTDVIAATSLAERMRRAIEAPLRLDGMSLDVESSIGIALYPIHGTTVDELLKHADFAMYEAKGRGTPFEVYAKSEEQVTPAQIGLLGEFRRALDESELVVHYQPAADLRSGELRGVEALVRWRHPRHGLLLPSEFVPMVEQTSLIRPLTMEVLDQSLRQSRKWLEQGLDLRIAVNLSPRSLQDPLFTEELQRLLHKWSIAPGRLDLEITESTIMSNPKRAMDALGDLRGLGVGLGLDDFGTGYSSLTYLRALPVDKIKIDKSFVENMATSLSDGVIVRSLIDLAHNLGLRVVAEGVENEVVWRELTQLGCDSAQGFYLSTPRPGLELTRWMAEVDGRRQPHGERLRAAV